MAIDDDKIKAIIEGVGKDIEKIREHLTGASKALVRNAQTTKAQEAVTKQLIKQNEELRETLKDNNLLSKERGKVIDENNKIIKAHSKETKRSSTGILSLKGAIMAVVRWFGKVIKAAINTGLAFAKTSSDMKTFGDAIDAGAKDIPGLGVLFSKFGKELDDKTQMFKGLAQSGATFGTNLTSMADAAYDAGMPLVQFQELIQNNTSTMARLFGTVNEGIPQIAALGRSLRTFTEKELAGFGLTMDETNQFLTTYMEIERARGRAGQLNFKNLYEGTASYAKNLTTLSRLTGESVTEIDKRNRSIAADGVFSTKMAKMDDDQRKRVIAAMALLPPAAQQAAKEFIGMGVPISDAAKGLSVFGGGKFEKSLLAFTNGVGDFTDNDLMALSNQFKTLGTGVVRGGEDIASAAMIGNSMAGESLNIFSTMAGQNANSLKFQEMSAKALEGNTKNLVNVQSALRRITTELQQANKHLFDQLVIAKGATFEGALESFTNGNTEFTKKLTSIFNKGVDILLNKGKTTDDTTMMLDPAKTLAPGALLAQHGTNGFQDFGTGTPAVLHGSEAVVPETSAFGSALAMLMDIKKQPANQDFSEQRNRKSPIQDVKMGQFQADADLSILNNSTKELVELNRAVVNKLNTLLGPLVGIERYTKMTSRNITGNSADIMAG